MPSDLQKEILDRVKILRTLKGLTQKDVAIKMGLSGPLLYLKLEHGKTRLTLNHLEALAKIFETSIAALIGCDDNPNKVLKMKIKELEIENKALRSLIVEIKTKQ